MYNCDHNRHINNKDKFHNDAFVSEECFTCPERIRDFCEYLLSGDNVPGVDHGHSDEGMAHTGLIVFKILFDSNQIEMEEKFWDAYQIWQQKYGVLAFDLASERGDLDEMWDVIGDEICDSLVCKDIGEDIEDAIRDALKDEIQQPIKAFSKVEWRWKIRRLFSDN